MDVVEPRRLAKTSVLTGAQPLEVTSTGWVRVPDLLVWKGRFFEVGTSRTQGREPRPSNPKRRSRGKSKRLREVPHHLHHPQQIEHRESADHPEDRAGRQPGWGTQVRLNSRPHREHEDQRQDAAVPRNAPRKERERLLAPLTSTTIPSGEDGCALVRLHGSALGPRGQIYRLVA